MRSILIRFAVPTLIAVSILAFFGVPYVDRILAEWFRRDVDLRAQLVAHSIEGSLRGFLERGDKQGLGSYLATITTDERLMAIVLCAEGGKPLFKTDRTPAEIDCSVRSNLGDRGSGIVKLRDGSVEVSSFPVRGANDMPLTALIVHDLGFIDRRQSSARNYVL
ncbi:MAG: Alpha,alpha-trehalose-phosphate synthase (UDP-forming), partial [Burkholderiales bacterium]|nr:Alpha,alpha-trehalose-phosphate synthase (UDP-forming) [Burkholderiales bacterium]